MCEGHVQEILGMVLGGVGTLAGIGLGVAGYRQKIRIAKLEREWKLADEIVSSLATAYADGEVAYLQEFRIGLRKLQAEINVAREALRDLIEHSAEHDSQDADALLSRAQAAHFVITALYGAFWDQLAQAQKGFGGLIHSAKREIGLAVRQIERDMENDVPIGAEARRHVAKVLELWERIWEIGYPSSS